MKVTSAANLRNEKPENLIRRVSELRRELMNLRFQKNGNQLKSTASFRGVRLEIARIKTILTEMNKKEENK